MNQQPIPQQNINQQPIPQQNINQQPIQYTNLPPVNSAPNQIQQQNNQQQNNPNAPIEYPKFNEL
jgi:hypothetical protein